MTTTPHHETHRKWSVYRDPTPKTPAEAWAGCSDKHGCVTGTDRAEVISKIDQKEDGNV